MFIFKRPPTLPRSSRPILRITETLGSSDSLNEQAANPETNALVLDAREATTLSDLDWLFYAAQKHASSHAFRKPGGRVVVMRRSQQKPSSYSEAVAVSEAMIGFAKSLAKENGSRGATVNLICDASTDKDAVKEPLDWLLSHHSCYVTGQELEVTKAAKQQDSQGAILITGSAGGIGKATAEFLCQDEDSGTETSSKFLLLDHPSTASKLEAIREKLAASDRAIDVLPLDLTQPDAADILSQAGVDLGGFQRIIHAAGITRDKTLKNMSYEKAWKPVLDVNLRAALDIDAKLLSTKGALQEDPASFVYFSSTSGISGNAGQSNYAASKSGLLGYATSMAANHPESNFHVVSPGFIVTEMTQKMPLLVRLVASKLNALGQGGKPEDVAAAVAFLSSPAASGLAPGFHLRVCGLFMGGR